MELRKGYKNTEVGVIPVDWEITKLSKVIESNRSIRYGIVQPGKFEHNGCLMLRSQDYSKGWSNSDEMHRVNIALENQYKNARLNKDDLIMTVVGAGIGQVVIAPDWLDGAIVSRSTARIAVDNTKAAKEYILCCLTSPLGVRQILNAQKEGAQPVISCLDLAEFNIPYPNLAEQTAIATALSDADALINGLDKLITKKRNIKQGAMQKLLQPKEGWEVKKLGEIAEVATGTTPPTRDLENYGNEHCFVSPADLGTVKYVTKTDKKLSRKGFSIARKFPKNSILFTCIGSTIGKSGIASFEMTSNQQINAIFPNDNFSSEYMFYYLSLISEEIRQSASEQAVPMINKTEFEKIIVLLPTKQEQIQIATILSDMDNEITALETKLEKYRKVKLGMMQNLLTGKIRLI